MPSFTRNPLTRHYRERRRTIITAWSGTTLAATRRPTITAGRRALIWQTYHFVYAPGIVGHGGTIASVFWIFMQAIVSPKRALCRVEHVDCDLAAGTGGTVIVQQT